LETALMKITLTHDTATSCTLHEVTNSTTTRLTIPVSADDLSTALRRILADPTAREAGEGAARIERLRDGLRVHAGNGTFLLPYAHLFALLIAEA
jgi:hypothetical protein